MDKASGNPTPAEAAAWFEGKDLTTDWLTFQLKVWFRILAPLREQPVQILELGSYEGRSAIAFLEYLPKSRITCVDTFEWPQYPQVGPQVETRFDGNMSHYPGRVEKIKARAVPALDALQADKRTFDLIYLDAGKERDGTFTQAVGAWPLLKVGGILIFDDLQWRPELPPAERPEGGIRLFCATFSSCLTKLHEGYQMIVRKTGVWPDPRPQTPERPEPAAARSETTE